MIVTIDGPAGAGKSSVARALAGRLGFRFLDTGAMYRAVALAAMERRVAWSASDELAALSRQISLQFDGDRLLLDGRDVSDEIRDPSVAGVIHHVADHVGVREHLVELQRREAERGDLVTEGRDQGTVVFPAAECKVFLTATPEERARRRVAQDLAGGRIVQFDEVLQQIRERDRRDETRPVGRLVPAADAVHVLTDGLTQEQVVDRLQQLVSERQLAWMANSA